MRHRPTAPARVAAGLALVALATGCSPKLPSALGGDEPGSTSASPSPEVPQASITTNVTGRSVAPDARVEVTAHEGTLTALTLKAVNGESAGSEIPGQLLEDGIHWRSRGRLDAGTTYAAVGTVKNAAGEEVPVRRRFATVALTDAQQAFPSVAPLNGETVGVGMPVVVTFDAPVTDHAAMERHMKVTATPAQQGSWYWLNDREVHWRPATYWKAGSDVKVDLDVNSVPAGGGIYGQESRVIDFHVGDAHVYKVNAQTHQMQVYSNGSLLRTLPITTGQPGFVTRSGTKVIMEKFRERTMDSETVGIGKDDPRYYHVDGVEYAMRLTYSGEFIHAAPWSVASQGHANVSHGCTGMSTANAAWLYAMTIRGDVVEYVGTDRPMTFTNGWGDWNLSFPAYQAGSAL